MLDKWGSWCQVSLIRDSAASNISPASVEVISLILSFSTRWGRVGESSGGSRPILTEINHYTG